MKAINVRQLLRNFTSIFPIPDEGILIRCRDRRNFVIAPYKKMSDNREKKSDENLSDISEKVEKSPPVLSDIASEDTPKTFPATCVGCNKMKDCTTTTVVNHEGLEKEMVLCEQCLKKLEEKGWEIK